jgi:hypothetical protein
MLSGTMEVNLMNDNSPGVMTEKIARVILGFKRRLIKKITKRSPGQRLKARLYYRKNKAKLKFRRRRYMQRNKMYFKTRKLFKRTKPKWFAKKKLHGKKPKIKHPKSKSVTHKIKKPKKRKAIKLHAPKRKKSK